MARISTHVLDLAAGRPAAGMRIELFGPGRDLICSAITNADGRTDVPLLILDSIETGSYELIFHAGAYWEASGDPAFFDEIPVRFNAGDPHGNYHVPLLLSPYGYSTYRGS
jgi:5-hydroxyisourate hydrolase